MNSTFHHVKEKALSDFFFFFSLQTPALSTHTHRILKEAAGSWIAVHLIAILTRHYKNNSANKLGAGLGRRSLRPHLLHPAELFISRGPQKNPAQSNMTNTLSQSHTGQIHLLYCYPPHHPPTPLSLSPHLLSTSQADVAAALFLPALRRRLPARDIGARMSCRHLSAQRPRPATCCHRPPKKLISV